MIARFMSFYKPGVTLLRLERLIFLLKCRSSLPQLSLVRLGLLGLLVNCGSLRIMLAIVSGQFSF